MIPLEEYKHLANQLQCSLERDCPLLKFRVEKDPSKIEIETIDILHGGDHYMSQHFIVYTETMVNGIKILSQKALPANLFSRQNDSGEWILIEGAAGGFIYSVIDDISLLMFQWKPEQGE